MNNIITFLIGAAVGAVAALLLAPQSGQELRSRLQDEASAEGQRIQAQYQKSTQDLHERFDKVQGDAKSQLEHNGEQGEQETATA